MASFTAHAPPYLGEYRDVFAPDLSLERCEGDQNSEFIEFAHDIEVLNSDIKQIVEPGMAWMTNALPFYHSHVLWSYSYCMRRFEDGSIGFGLIPVGPYLTNRGDGRKPNASEAQMQPRFEKVACSFMDKEGNEKETCVRYARDLIGEYTEDELLARADGDRIYLRLRVVLARSYFSLSKLLKEPTTVSEETKEIVKTILRGEKPPGYDWSITVGEASPGGDSSLPRTFYVHANVLSNFSDAFKKVFKTGRFVTLKQVFENSDGETIEMTINTVPDKRRLSIDYLAPDDMTVLIPAMYGMDAPLPSNIDRTLVVERTLGLLLKEKSDVLRGIYQQWERAICEQALALDKTDPANFKVIVRLLRIIWYAMYGKLPLAKRVAIGVFADMARLSKPPGISNADHIRNEESAYRRSLIPPEDTDFIVALGIFMQNEEIIRSMTAHYECVAAVRKVGLSTLTEKPKEDVVVVEATAPDSDGQTDISDDYDDEEEEEEDMKRLDDGETVSWPAAGTVHFYDKNGNKKVISMPTICYDQTDDEDDDDKEKEEMKGDYESPPTPADATEPTEQAQQCSIS